MCEVEGAAERLGVDAGHAARAPGALARGLVEEFRA